MVGLFSGAASLFNNGAVSLFSDGAVRRIAHGDSWDPGTQGPMGTQPMVPWAGAPCHGPK